MYVRFYLTSVLILLMTGASFADDIAESNGAEILKPFKQQLQTALKDGMKKGVIETISACQIEAPRIAKEMSKDGISVGRTSHRLRNPNNTAPAWVEPIMQRYLADSAIPVAQTVQLPNEKVGYVEPIFAKPLCITCHGENIAGPVASKIQALYPDDEATGFKVGDLRGVFWLEYPSR